MIKFLRFLILAGLIASVTMKWRMDANREAELRRAREMENAGPVHKLVDKVKSVQERLHERMHEHMREHMEV